MRKLYFTAVLLLCTFLSYSQTQWIGPAGGDWSTAANWTNGVPAAGNDALITGGSDIAINDPLIIDFGVTNFSGDIAVNADVFNIGNFINSGGNMGLSNGALFLNSGSVTFTNDGPFSNDGTFLNYGTFQQNGNGVFDNNPTGVFINFGNITNVGNFNNNGTVENFGSLTNASTFVNNALTRNCGQFINTFVSTLDNTVGATFHNKAGAQLFIDKDFNNAGTLDDDGSTTVNASGVVNNTGTININGIFQLSTIFNNNGIVNIAGTYTSNFGTTNNNSTWNNTGSTQNLGTFNNNAGGTLPNTGTLMNASCALFFQRSNGTINSLTNDGVLYDLAGTVNTTGASQGVALQNANAQPTPVLICRDIQIQTDANGDVSITAGDVLVDGDAKYCNIVTLEVTQTDFTCADLGVNPVTVTLTDGFNNSNTCTVNVTVVERSPNPCNNSFLNYCNSAASNGTTSVFIEEVSLAEISNTSGNSTYTDFTAQVATLEFGDFYDLEVVTQGTDPEVTIAIWIDWNNDGDFNDADEEIYKNLNGATTASAVVNVPGTALPGTTRMRVSMRAGGDIDPCSTNIVNGEVEDYTIMIASQIVIQNCVGDIVVSAAPGATEQLVGWIPPKGFSTCQNGVDIEFVSGIENGNAFPIGETVNTLRFVDGCGGEQECDFTVTVNPTPVTFSLACIDDVILEGSAGLGGAIANWLAPFPTASCPQGVNLPVQTVGPTPGQFLPTGTRVTVCYEATDNCGNTDNCCFEVFVTDPAETLEFNNCPSIVTVDAAPGAAGAVVTYPTLTATSSCAAGGMNIILQDGLPSGSFFANGSTTVTYRAIDNCNSAELCSFIVMVNQTPSEVTVNCPDDIVVDVNPGASSQVVNYSAVTATSDCPGPIQVTQTQGLPSGNAFPLGNTVIQYMVNDACGDMETCTFNVTLNTQGATTSVNCPNDLTVNAAPGDVGAVVTWNTPNATSDCFAGNASVTLVSALSSGDQFPLGTQEVIYFASDDCGSSDGCSFFVTVEPTQADLNLSCRNNITRNINVGANDPAVSWTAPTGTTTCGGNVNITQIAGPNSGSRFAPGVTTITYRGTDNCGNVELCSFDVIVNVTTPANAPEITVNCVNDINVTAAPGQTVASVGFDVPTATTTCNTSGGGGGGGSATPTVCAQRTVSNVHQCSNNVDKSMWIAFDGLEPNYGTTNGQFTEYSDGTASFTATIINNGNSNIRFDVVGFFSGRTTTAPAGSPKISGCVSPNYSEYYYYTNVSGTLTGRNNAAGAFLKFSRVAEAFQVGPGADVTGDDLSLGASGWLDVNIISQPSGSLNLSFGDRTEPNDADFNFKISGNNNTCRDNGIACSGVSNSIAGYTYLGQFQGSKYYRSNTNMSFATANTAAQGLGGNLIAIGSQAENDFITSVTNSGFIGFTDQASEGNFVWTNGEPITYTNWNAGEPNNFNNNEDFGTLRANGTWNDGGSNNSAIIEIACPSCEFISDNIAGYTFIGDFEGSKYYVANSATSWATARANAEAAGGNLAVVTNQAENDFIQNNGTASSGSYWLGLENVNNTATFRWITGETFNYSNWNTGEPNGTSNQVYARLVDSNGRWTDRQGADQFNGILEISCGSNNGGGSSEATITQVHGLAPNTNFPIGTTTVVYEVTDDCGNTAYCAFDVTVNQPNSAIALNNCPTDITVTAAAGATSAVANFGAPTATSDCTQGDVVTSQTSGFESGAAFPVGQTTVIYRAVDGCGNEQFCSFFVNVEATPPAPTEITVNCPNNISVEAAAGANSATVTFNTPTATTTCNGNVNITQIGGLPSGSAFPIGLTVIFYRLADECGNVESCAFNVIVNPTPSSISIDCPANISVDAAPDAEFATASFGTATATSDCFTGNENIIQIGGLPSGSLFPVGNSVVFFKATDACGNFAVCNFLVTVNATPITNVSECLNAGGDADNDGVCADIDCDDNNPLVSQAGDACNDGNPATINDVIQADCSCAGVIPPCVVDGGELIGGPFNFCVDGTPDNIPANGITVLGGNGNNGGWVITDETGNILGLPPTFTAPDFDAAGVGTCFVYSIAYENNITGLATGNNISDLGGCFDLSNSVTVVREICAPNCDVDGGTLTGGPFNFCVDGTPDNIPANGITLAGETGANTGWVVTDDSGTILGLPPTFTAPDFDAAGVGTCFIYAIAYENDLTGLAAGNNISSLGGCFDLSNRVTVVREICNTFDCPALSANIGDACDDGNASTNNDTVQSDCTCAGTPVQTGCNATYTLDGLDIDFQNVDAPISTVKVFDITFATVFACDNFGGTACADNFTVSVPSAGTYFIQIQTYQDWATPLCDVFETVEIGGTPPVYDCPALSANIGDSCDDSDANTVNDVVQADCSCDGTPVGTFNCPALSANIGDSCDDGNASTNNDTVQSDCTCEGTPVSTTCDVTYTVNGTTVDIQNLNAPITTAKIFDVNFVQVFGCDNFGGTACQLNESISLPESGTYFISVQTYADWATPLCDFFETIETSENTGGCTANGGTLSGGPFNFCVDGTPDNIPGNGINISGGSGTNNGWVVTDDSGNILGLPPTFTAPDFDAAGVGTCFIYYIAYENDLTGLAAGNNISNLDGCFDLSNSVTVVREICGTVDCPALSANIGDTCDDGDSNTNNDTVQSDCSCAGTPVQTGCATTYTVDGLTIDFQNANAPISTVKVFDNTFAQVFGCDNFGGTACANNFSVNLPNAGTYFVQIQTYQDWATPLCNVFDEINATGGGGTEPTCDNVTGGGTISGDETVCAGDDAGPITSSTFPSGGSGTMEYIWLSSISGCPINLNDQIAGANQSTYDPGVLNETTYFKRLSRRTGCTDWFSGESNCVAKTVDDNCGGSSTCDATYTVSGMDITLDNIANNIAASAIFDNTFAPVFQCNNFGGTACNNTEVVTVPRPGTYFVQIQTYSDWSNQLCNIFEEVTVGGSNNGRAIEGGETDKSFNPSLTTLEQPRSVEFRLSPNPAREFVNISLSDFEGKNVQIQLIDQIGKVVRNVKLEQVNQPAYQMLLSNIPNGFYSVRVFAERQKPVSKKLIISSAH